VATIEEYQAAAPNIMALGEFTVNQIENKFATIPDPPGPGTPTPVDKQTVIDIFEQLFARQDVDTALKGANGYGELGKQHGITKKQAKTIVEELRAMYAVYVADQGE
jgi:hypothetical protein